VGASPPGDSLPPEAIRAVMDEKTSGAQICMRRADTVQLHAQEIDEPTKIRIVVQSDPRAALLAMRARRGTGGSNPLPSTGESLRTFGS
jgi:hypothetical protein